MRHRHPHVQISPAQPFGALGQGAEVAGHARRDREDSEECQGGEPQPHGKVPCRGPADLLQGLAEGPGHPDRDPGGAVGTQGHHPVGRVPASGGLSWRKAETREHLFVVGIWREEPAFGVVGKGNRPLATLGP